MADRLNRNNIAVVIPALNEALRIRGVVEGALAECPNVIVIDDGSEDDTIAQIADLPIVLLRHPQRRGKGASLRGGFEEALRRGFKGVLTMDGDGQHLAADIPRLLEAASRYPDHIVIGARLRKRAQQPRYRRLANAFGDWGIAWGTGYRIADTQSGQRLYPAAVAALGDVPGEDVACRCRSNRATPACTPTRSSAPAISGHCATSAGSPATWSGRCCGAAASRRCIAASAPIRR